jgi:hypothetical protein
VRKMHKNRETLADILFKELENKAIQKLINVYKNIRCFFIRLPIKEIVNATNIIEERLEKYKGRSEVIKLLVSEGYFMDTGIETLKVEYGLIWEVYDYPSFTHYLIRLLKIVNHSGNGWVAIYIDENPDTAWWTEEERKIL